MKKLVAALACRNQGSRLYGKPLQNLNVKYGIKIIDNIVGCLSSFNDISETVLGISEGVENEIFIDYAKSKNLPFIVGDEIDVLSRLVMCGELAGATDIFRVTSESPFTYHEMIASAWKLHINNNNDATFLDDIIDGCGFEIISLDALKNSHKKGRAKHRSELCSLFIRENKDRFKVEVISPPSKLSRKDIRLTVDYPEDLIVCRAVFAEFEHQAPKIKLAEVVDFLDRNPDLKKLIAPFCEIGYRSMYL